ncbi:hypothetical protein DPMN_164218 [Dreissena polymorpha]|uniref:CCHC-type domain-containing protein n=1 Tax=Dreissena polymorpha TaxID=45954 RepID=A0A9D4EXB7_DREPO|nr:hypothetical protein DPMN_164218 [Dreissena polymorpha]
MRKSLLRIESRLDRLEKFFPRGPPFQNFRHKKPETPGCFGCKANDHFWRDCPNTKRNRFTNSNNMLQHNQQPPNRMFEQKRNVLNSTSFRRQMNDNRSEN